MLSLDRTWIRKVAWSAGGTYLAGAGIDGNVYVWETEGGSPHPTLLRGHVGEVLDVDWSKDTARLISSGLDGTVRVWDRAAEVEVQVFRGHDAAVRAVGWSPDDSMIATAGLDGVVRVWRTHDDEPTMLLTEGRRLVSRQLNPEESKRFGLI